MMALTPTRRPLSLKIGAWLEIRILQWKLRIAEKELKHCEHALEFAKSEVVLASEKIDVVEKHIVDITQRLGRAKWK